MPSAQPQISVAGSNSLAYLPEVELSFTSPPLKFENSLLSSSFEQAEILRSQSCFASKRLKDFSASKNVSAENELHLIKVTIRHCQIVSQAKFNCILSKKFYDNSKLCLFHNSSSATSRLDNSTELHPAVNLQVYSRKFGLRKL